MHFESMENVLRFELAPTGKLRAGINFGNTVLVRRATTGAASGIAIDLANELARRANLSLELVTYETAGKMAASARESAWDIAFLASEPERAHEIHFSPPYLEIETTCLVRRKSAFREVWEVDRKGVRIVVSTGSAYDLFLTRTLRHAEVVRAPSPTASAELFFAGTFEALAGIRPMLAEILRTREDIRLLDGRFSAVQQAIGTPRGRNATASYIHQFVEEIKSSGLLAQIIEKNGVTGVAIPTK